MVVPTTSDEDATPDLEPIIIVQVLSLALLPVCLWDSSHKQYPAFGMGRLVSVYCSLPLSPSVGGVKLMTGLSLALCGIHYLPTSPFRI